VCSVYTLTNVRVSALSFFDELAEYGITRQSFGFYGWNRALRAPAGDGCASPPKPGKIFV
jgi:hypothetical protein